MVSDDEAVAAALPLARRQGGPRTRPSAPASDARIARGLAGDSLDARPRARRVERSDELPPARTRCGRADHRGPRPAQGPRAVVEAGSGARRPHLLRACGGSGVRRSGRAAGEHDGRARRDALRRYIHQRREGEQSDCWRETAFIGGWTVYATQEEVNELSEFVVRWLRARHRPDEERDPRRR